MAKQSQIINNIRTHAKKGWTELESSERSHGAAQCLIALALIEALDVPQYAKMIDNILTGKKTEMTAAMDTYIVDVMGWGFQAADGMVYPTNYNGLTETGKSTAKKELAKKRNKITGVIGKLRPVIYRAKTATKADRARCKLNTRNILTVPGSLFYDKKKIDAEPELKKNVNSLSGGEYNVRAWIDHSRDYVPEETRKGWSEARGTGSNKASGVTDFNGACDMIHKQLASWQTLEHANKDQIEALQGILIELIRLDIGTANPKKKGRGKKAQIVTVLDEALDMMGEENETIAKIIEFGSVKPEADAA